MLGSYTAQESVLALLVAALTLYELQGLLRARLAGRSKNFSRLLSHSLMLLLLGPWVGFTFYWVSVMDAPGVSTGTFGSSALSLPYLSLGIGLLVIASLEILSLYRARRAGYTTNLSRFVTHGLIVSLVLSMVVLSILKWNDYATSEANLRISRVSYSAANPLDSRIL